MTATVENDCRGGLFENGDGAPGSVEHFKSTMYSMQSRRRSIVRHLLDGQGVEERAINALQDTLDELQDADTINYQREMTTAHDSFSVNIRDETVGLKKDLSFLSALREAAAGEGEGAKTVDELLGKMDLSRVLAPHHPKGEAVFRQELEWTERFLLSFVDSHSSEGRRPVLITDWDGTMKDYCSQYATNLQPVYSAVTMARFATRFTRLSAVLTAGPLRGPGILDLTALPIDGPVLFSGSWGREWWLGGRRVVHDDGISDEGFDALERLNDEMGALLSGGDYTQFALVGSGVQRKVDRLTLGVQTVCGQVAPELSTRYQEEVRERMHRVDPYQQILVFDPSTELEVEVCVHSSGTVWNKANGVSRLVETVGDSLIPPGRVLICGDTSSDLPMVRQAKQDNTQGVMALFVGANEALQKTVRECVDDDSRVCFVSCPDVIHAAMSRILVRKMESSV